LAKRCTSIVIHKNPPPKIAKDFEIRPTFNVLYSKNFDPNTCVYITYAQDVDKVELPGLLMELSQLYFENLVNNPFPNEPTTAIEEPKKINQGAVYQCSECLSIYDPELGDHENNILPGTSFEGLPVDYTCNICEAPKSQFQKIELSILAE